MSVTTSNKRISKQHFLKILPHHFDAIVGGEMRAQVRFDDCGFCVGDELFLMEYDAEKDSFTAAMTVRLITNIKKHYEVSGLQAGYVLISHQ